MSQLEEIQTVQKNLEESFVRKMDELQAQLQAGGTAKDTVAKVAEEFRTFRELIFSILGLLRKQIAECIVSTDSIDTWQRRKVIIFSGIPEADRESCTNTIVRILHSKMGLDGIKTTSVKTCHRLGVLKAGYNRPILVRFDTMDTKAAVWNAKTRLKGSSISVKEFLTRIRQALFAKARLYFGMRRCWTQDGVILVRTQDGQRCKLTTAEELQRITDKHPKPASSTRD